MKTLNNCQDILNSVSIPMYMVDINDYTIIDANSATGFSDKAGKVKCYEVTHKLDKPCDSLDHICPLSLVKNTKKQAVVEHVHYDTNGNKRYVQVNGFPVFDDSGNLVSMIELIIDITDRVRLEEELKKSHKYLTDLMLNSSDMIWEVDINACYTFVSDTVKDIFGYLPEEVIGKSPFDFMAEDEAQKMKEIFSELCSSMKPMIDLESCNISKSGKVVCRLSNGVPITDENGNLIGYRGIDKDITNRKQLEEKLLESEDRYRKLFTESNDAIFVFKYQSTMQEANLKTCELLDYEADRMLELYIVDLFPKKEYPTLINEFRNLFNTGSSRFETKLIRKNGDEIDVDMSVSLVDKENGMIQGIVRDISERKKYEQKLEQSEKKFKSLFENMTDSFALHKIILDEKGHPVDYVFLDVNNEFEKSTGLKRDEVIGRKATEVFPGLRTDRVNWIEIYGKVAIEEVEIRFEDYSDFFKRHYSVSAYCPAPMQFATVFSDITEKVMMEEQIRESEEKFRTISSAAQDAIIMIDSSGNITFGNKGAEKIFGYKPGDIIGMNFNDLFTTDEFFETLHSGFEIFRDSGVSPIIGKTSELKAKRNDGSEFSIEVSFTSIKLKGDWYLVGIARDITDRKIAEEELINITLTKDKFYSIIAHDLRGPMGMLTKLTALLADEFETFDPEDRNLFLKEIKENSENIFNLLENLLTWSRAQKGSIQFHPANFYLNQTIDHILKYLRVFAASKKILISSEITSDVEINADENMLKTIIRNLIANSIKYTPANGHIKIYHKIFEEYIQIYVEDNGVGMDKDTMDKLFKIDKFHSTEGTFGEKGTGLGLILCKEFVEKHSGNIYAESELGVGSTFSFTIPNKIVTES